MATTGADRVEALFAARAAEHPARAAIIYGGRTWTYGDVRDEMARRAALLVAAGLATGSVVATTEAVSDEMAVTFLACCRAGLTFLPLSPQWTRAELAPLIERARVAAILTPDGAPHSLFPTLSALPMTLPGDPDAVTLDEAAVRSARGMAESAAIIQTTSGTTGSLPKLALIPHHLLTWRAAPPHQSWWIEETSVLYTPSANLLPARDYCEILCRGGTMVFSRTAQPEQIEAELAACGATILATVPAILQLLAEAKEAPPDALALHTVRFSAAPMAAATWRAIERRYRATVVQEYASTEGGWMIGTPAGGAPLGSIGLPSPGVATRIVDEQGADVPDGAVGELVIRPPTRMTGYLGDPDATARTIRDGWLWTGDLARRDADGFYSLEGRRGLRINVGGLKVSPEEIEAVLEQHPAVREAVVLGVADAARGEIVRAIIVPHGETPSIADLRRFCRERLAPYKVPRRWEFRIGPLPRSAMGKVLRHNL